MLDYINLDKIKNKIKEITNGTVIITVSEKAKKIGVLMKDLGYTGTLGIRWAKVLSLILGENIPYNSCNTKRVIGTMYVPLVSNDGHNYILGDPFLVDNVASSKFLRMNGKLGNSIRLTDDICRKATNDEIDKFFTCFDYSCGKAYILNFIKKLI